MHLVIDRELASGPSLAVEKLAGMLNLQGETVRVVDAPGEEPSLLIGLAGRSKVVAKGLARSGLECPSAPESVLLHPLTPNQFLIAGNDERGLTYALLEAARAIQIAPTCRGIRPCFPPRLYSHRSWFPLLALAQHASLHLQSGTGTRMVLR